MFKLEFDTSNAAFDDDRNAAVARVLLRVAGHINDGKPEGHMRDENGNTIGQWSLTQD